MKYYFDVSAYIHKVVEIEAENDDEAYEKMYDRLYDVDMEDADEYADRRFEMLDI